MDQGSSVRNNTGENQFATDNYNLQREHALSKFHNGKRFVSSVLYELPFGRGKRFLSSSGAANWVVDGWQMGTLLTLSNGTPINVGQIGDPLQIGMRTCPMRRESARFRRTGRPTSSGRFAPSMWPIRNCTIATATRAATC